MSLGATLRESARRRHAQLRARRRRGRSIRGLDGDRVLILQDGQRIGDLSSQSGDHGVPVNPAAAQRIEVVRGPATLLYGANAIGGLVNMITDEIPTRPIMGATGNFTFDVGSAATEAGGGRRRAPRATADSRCTSAAAAGASGDVETPEGEVPNSQSRSGFGNVGAAWTGTRGYFGGSYGYDDTKYGIPLVEERQHPADAAAPRVHAARRRAERLERRVRLVPRHARACGATSTTSSTATRSAPRSATTPTRSR